MPGILVTYYSRTGITARVAEDLAARLAADIEPVHDERQRQGVLGFLIAGKEATLKSMPAIAPAVHDPGGYGLVVIGTPVWAGTMASPVRTWLTRYGAQIQRAALFCTTARTSREQTLDAMAALCRGQVVARLGLLEKDVKRAAHGEAVAAFAEAIRTAAV